MTRWIKIAAAVLAVGFVSAGCGGGAVNQESRPSGGYATEVPLDAPGDRAEYQRAGYWDSH